MEILLDSELNLENRYEVYKDEEDKTKKTLLHYAAELGFLQVTKTLVKKCPGLLAAKTELQLVAEKKSAMLPVEMNPKMKVRNLHRMLLLLTLAVTIKYL